MFLLCMMLSVASSRWKMVHSVCAWPTNASCFSFLLWTSLMCLLYRSIREKVLSHIVQSIFPLMLRLFDLFFGCLVFRCVRMCSAMFLADLV